MAEGRILKKKISVSKQVNDLSNDTNRLLFTWLIPHLDAEGRFFGEAEIVKSIIFPRRADLSAKRIEEGLKNIENCGLGFRYIDKKSNDKVLQINGFFNNQNINKDREAPSNFTPPDGNSRPTPELLKSTSAESKLREDKVIEDVLTDLNSCLKTAYKTTNVKTRELIRARLNDGFTLENFKTVHRKKISEWGNDKEMRVYLRPITLYGTKFESYLNQPELKEVGGGFKKP